MCDSHGFYSLDGAPPTNRDDCIYPKGNQLSRKNALNPNCDPMTYVLFFHMSKRIGVWMLNVLNFNFTNIGCQCEGMLSIRA